MRLRALIAVILAALASAVALSGCGSSAVAIDPLARAADVTAHAGGAHMQLTARIESGLLPDAVTMAGGGYFNYTTHEGTFSLQLTGLPSSAGLESDATIEEIFKGSTLYLSSPLLAGKLPDGARWMSIDITRVGQAAGLDPTQLLGGQSNPAQILEYLKAKGASVTKVGANRIRGVPTTHYTATIDLSKAASGLGGAEGSAAQKAVGKLGLSQLPVDVWVDSHNLVRRIQISIHIGVAGQNLQMAMNLELFGFGATPTVSAPPASETFDATSTALSGLGSASQ